MNYVELHSRSAFTFLEGASLPETLAQTCAAQQMPAMTSEVSLSGCYLETMFTLDVGTALDIVIWLDGEKLTAKGVIATKYPQVGNGIDITEMKPESRAKLEAFLKAQEVQIPKF